MPETKKSLFRKESLERLSSPERLEQLMQVVRPKDWLYLATSGALLVLAVFWSIFGRIPVTVSGRGVLLPQKVVQSQSPGLEDSQGLVSLAYFTIGDGKRIQPGMKMMITPDTVKRETSGGILGKVTFVSAFPITKESAAGLIGNAELADALISQGGQMQVVAQLTLDPSTFSGYAWSSSQGPKYQKISSGTTTSVSVTLEEKAPITFVFPIFQ